MAIDLHIAARRIARIVRQLEEAELISVEGAGRHKTYSLNPSAPARQPALADLKLANFMRLFGAV
jgi:hypothetical protein